MSELKDTRITININSKHVLDEMFANDKETQLLIRKKVLQQFINSTINPNFDKETQDWLKNVLLRNVRKTVHDACKEEIELESLEPYIREQVQKVINKIIDEELSEMIDTKIRKELQNRLKKIKI